MKKEESKVSLPDALGDKNGESTVKTEQNTDETIDRVEGIKDENIKYVEMSFLNSFSFYFSYMVYIVKKISQIMTNYCISRCYCTKVNKNVGFRPFCYSWCIS